MNATDDKKLFKALADFQQEVEPLVKNVSGYGYKYADLAQIIEKINPLLKKHGLGFSQPLDGTAIKTILFHTETSETIESVIEIPEGVQLKGMNEFQVLGSAITYLRRYSLASVLGLVVDEDNDAAGEQTSPKPATQRAKAGAGNKWVPSQTKPATLKQKEFIANLMRQHGVEVPDMKDYLADEFGITGEFSQADAQHIIEMLDTKQR